MIRIVALLFFVLAISADIILSPVQGDSEAIKFHLWAAEGTNEFSEVAVIGTNSFFQITNRMVGRWRFYVVSEDEEGNLSERSSYVVVKPKLKKPVLVLHESTAPVFISHQTNSAEIITNFTGSTRAQLQVLSGPNRKPLERKDVDLPPPPIP